jgi:formylglycine-generating enzyme required for sulfatase activity
LPAYGEVLVEVDTNLRTPQTLSRVRFDLFDEKWRWFESRDVPTPDVSQFPLSFSLFSDSASETRTAWLRVRGYLEGHVRDYRGERFARRPTFTPPSVSTSLATACRDAPELAVGQPLSLRLQGEPFADAQLSCVASSGTYTKRTHSGLAVFRLPILAEGQYRVAVTSAQPGIEWASVADTVLAVRRACEAPESEVACNDDERVELGNLAGLQRDLEPGDYYVLVGNVAPGPMDVTLLVQQDQFASNEPATGEGDLLTGKPRLVVDDVDITPTTEPEPHLAVDRLLRLEVAPQIQATAHVLLDGECLGTMADLENAASCVNREGELLAVELAELSPGREHGLVSEAGSWSKYRSVPCEMDDLSGDAGRYDERVCVTGGSFVLGDATLIARGADGGSPERLATIPTFVMDRFEYSVARYRAARARGFVPPDAGPFNNFEPVTVDTQEVTRACTWNEALDGSSLFPEQEELPLSCVSWLSAQALCDFEGGRLPSVAEREFAASAAEQARESTYPWGERLPGCDEAVFGRWPEPSRGSTACFAAAEPVGPRPVAAEPWARFDRSPCGVVGLGGNVAEWTRDSHRSYADDCWQSQAHLAPECDEAEAPLRSIAGGSWRSTAAGTRSALRVGGAVAGIDPWVGLRCVYPVGKP